jgi:hypothetical protein
VIVTRGQRAVSLRTLEDSEDTVRIQVAGCIKCHIRPDRSCTSRSIVRAVSNCQFLGPHSFEMTIECLRIVVVTDSVWDSLFESSSSPICGYCGQPGLLRLHSRYGPPDRSAAHGRPLSRGSNPCGYPHKPLVSYRINRELSGWIPPLMIRAFGAHCHKRTCGPQQISFDHFVGDQQQVTRNFKIERPGRI